MDTKYEYKARIELVFNNILPSSRVIFAMNKNIRVTQGGASFINIYSPSIMPQSVSRQKLVLVEFNNYTSSLEMYLGHSSKIETFQLISSNNDEIDEKSIHGDVVINFYIQQDKLTYQYYPVGILQGLSKLGGIIAIFNISILLNILHQYKFSKEINQELSSNSTLTKDIEDAKEV